MLDLFYSMAAAVIELLVMVLPDSPITDWLATFSMEDSAIVTGLGWLNWLVDINACLLIFTAWLACVAVYYGARYGISVFGGTQKFVRSVIGTIGGVITGGGGE